MRSDLPKVAHEVADRGMVLWVAQACAEAGCSRIIVVVGYQQEVVRDLFAGWPEEMPPVEFAVQSEQLGTGHAVVCAKPHFADAEMAPGEGGKSGHDVFVLAGDGPLIRAETLRTLHDRHVAAGASASLATAVLDDADGYGRIWRDEAGGFRGIVEQKDATPEQLEIREVNPSYYCFDAARLFDCLQRVTPSGASGEYYITDVPGMLNDAGEGVVVVDAVPAEDVLSINTPEHLAIVDGVLRERLGMPARQEHSG